MDETRLSPGFDEVCRRRIDRRAALQRLAGLSATFAWSLSRSANTSDAARPVIHGPGGRDVPATSTAKSTLTFTELEHGADDRIHVAAGHRADVLISWGDPLFAEAPTFDPVNQSRARQERQFGTENDFLAYFPLPRGSRSSTRGLLCVNHEGANPELMFPGLTREDALHAMTTEQIDVEMAAQGHSIVEVERTDESDSTPDRTSRASANTHGAWRVVPDSPYARRMTGAFPAMRIRGPAAGHDRLKTSADPTGTTAMGALNCCSGGTTPWGTLLIGEENVNQYFHGDPSKTREARNHARMAVGTEEDFAWSRIDPRFDVEREPNEPNRFGWVIEVDPYEPTSVPVRRTALGRFKHEGATCVEDPDGRVVVYMGDDDEFEFIYKFVSARARDLERDDRNRDLLDEGTLFAARFDANGELHWLPLTFGRGPLVPENGFHSQADVLIEARHAATLLGATPMDRPEDIEVSPSTGCVYAMLTKNKLRQASQIDTANPRATNYHGHVIEFVPPVDERGVRSHAAEVFRWEMFLVAGDPRSSDAGKRGTYHPDVSRHGWFGCPDNCTFDDAGRLWIATDGMSRDGLCNGLYAMDTHGPGRALPRHFFRAPLGGEVSGPCFTPDGRTLFLSIQHPGQSNQFGKKVGDYSDPTTRFPDYREAMPPRPSIVVIVRPDGGKVGT